VYLSQNKQTSKQVKCQNNLFPTEEQKLSTIYTKTTCPLPRKKNKCQGTDYIGPRPQVCNKSKDKEQQKATFPLNDPLIRSLNRKTTRKHTSHHYLIIYTKNTGNGGLKVLWWVLTTHTHSGKLLDHDPTNEASSQKRKKELD
jgi:hypothetical protein